MTALLPTRVSLYDFLIEDTCPIDAIFADIGSISIPQARVIIQAGIQGIISGLLAYNQMHGADAVIKKLLVRNQVKDLRKFNAFNLKTMNAAYQNGNTINDTLFDSNEIQKQICLKIAMQARLNPNLVRHLLGGLSLLCIREISILADYAHLDEKEIEHWFNLQPQFFQLKRGTVNAVEFNNTNLLTAYKLPQFDSSWHDITGYQQPITPTDVLSEQMPHYAKVIERADQNSDNNYLSAEEKLIVDNSNHSDVLTFDTMPNISLPYQRWLLQLAKISDIYISRRRLKIAPEPVQPPSRPFVNFGFLDTQKSKKFDGHDVIVATNNSSGQLWKNPIIILLVLVLGGLSLMAIGKYKYKQSKVITHTNHSNNALNLK
ncbi:hypothetical protein [Psychrobacter sp.]|uniref:hypothetical protein n=1 Tax=Psychrobacter sp. TaxID=56811 RepID=UPI0025EF9541|nr:hypothetical protein [Psychrobacter sp.]